MAIEYVNATQLDSDLTSVADAIRAKSGGSSDLAFPAGFVSEIQAIPSGGADVYVSSTGLLYTPVMTIDLSMERSNGYKLTEVLNRYGEMPYLEELTMTGILRPANDKDTSIIATNGTILFPASKYPLLKKLYFQPTEMRTTNGSVIESDSERYMRFTFGDNAFTDTNLTDLVIGRVGGAYHNARKYGWFRNDMPVPPGSAATNIGSLDGLNLTIYTSEYNDCFLGVRAPNTTYVCRDYITGEVLTP